MTFGSVAACTGRNEKLADMKESCLDTFLVIGRFETPTFLDYRHG